MDKNELDYAVIIREELRDVQIWNRNTGKFLGAVKLDEDLSSWTPFYATGIKYLPIIWAVEKLQKSILESRRLELEREYMRLSHIIAVALELADEDIDNFHRAEDALKSFNKEI